VFLKSLTLRGFKSFADKTTLEFEPGITVVVGPNGSGKSNVVDSVAWVLGAQGARSLRGAKMDDVIFAGTPDRPALGRAEVSLTIDNTAGLLPIEFSEVTITRTLFRTGESEYQINGAPCRLLDIQELLSDSGIGRQQHVIVGQGQLDTILNSRPEDRRAVVEEAAGILKFRKRREKAERRLEATEGNLLRLQDLVREVRRGLGPLQRQADAARRHDGLVDELRAIKLHLAGHEIAGLQTRRERLRDKRTEHDATDRNVRARLRELDTAVLEAEHALSALGDDELGDALVRVESLRERGRGLRALAAERRRGLERELAAAADTGVVETLVADAAALRAELESVERESGAVAEPTRAVEDAERDLVSQRDALAETEADDAAQRAAQVRRDLQAAREALRRGEDEIGRVEARRRATEDRLSRLADDEREASAELERAERESTELGAALERASERRRVAEDRRHETEASFRRAEGESQRWRARAEALAQALDAARAGTGADQIAGLNGVVGPLVDHLEIEEGAEVAVAVALGDALRAVVVDGGAAAREVLHQLKAGDAAGLLLVLHSSAHPVQERLAPPRTRPLVDCVRTAVPALHSALARLLDGVMLAEGDWSEALGIALANPELVLVTHAGDCFGGARVWRAGGDEDAGVTQAALDDALQRTRAADEMRAGAEAAVASARAGLDESHAAEAAARDAARAGGERRHRAVVLLEQLQRETVTRTSELEQLAAELDAIRHRHQADDAFVAELQLTLPGLEAAEQDAESRAAALARARAELEDREREVGARRRELEMQAAALHERRGLLERRLAEVETRLARDPEAQAAAERHRAQLASRAQACASLVDTLDDRLATIASVHERVSERRRKRSEEAGAAGRRLDVLRTGRAELEQQLAGLREQMSRVEIEEAETRMRLEAAVEKLRAEFDCEPAAALDAPAPDVPDGTTLAGRARELERELRVMGPVNPLALQEFDELRERHEFLQSQLEDVKESRKELMRVIRAVDREIVTVFDGAFADVSRHFDALFATLFPGGSGRIFLTDPEDMLDTGIEIEARPSGKNTRRLSLLSGGERSLTALAFLFAVFRARPSPFYLLDEVEAALDDVNLHRFLDLIHEFRDEAQLLIVSHQKRTMEAADCLYGVSMPPGGSSRVVGQRMTGDEGLFTAAATAGP
jgi:chromosome segregation protein